MEKVLLAADAEDSNPLKLDNYVLEQVQLALKLCKNKVDTDFYESAADYLGNKPEPVVEEAVEEEVAAEEAPEESEKQEEQ